MPARVADASVLAAMFFGEPRAGEAESLLRGAELYEPTLLAYELTSVARKKVLQDPVRREAIVLALTVALGIDIRWVEVPHVTVLQLALETGLTSYDASYLQVARSFGVPLVTFDQRLLAASGSQP